MNRRPTHHADKARTRDDHRAALAQYLTWARSLDGVTVTTLKQRHGKLTEAEIARELDAALARRAAHG